MCGIVGKLYVDEKKRVREAELVRMGQAVKHRGPDDQGVVTLGPVGLGNRRLAIIDLSPGGHQPMATPDKKIWITFNGEIHNYLELRRELEKKGERFRTQSDTEVILILYRRNGVNCLKFLRGQFAFAIWDEKKKQLFAARDRLGINPFKYYFDGLEFIFASELKAILTDPVVPREPDYQAIDEYLTYQYVPAPKTGFKNISKLPAAHYLLLKGGKLTTHRYWDLSYQKKEDLSEEEWVERIRAKIDEAVRLRMISDAPLGAFLSGGTDSSAVVYYMSKNSSRPVETFSIGFPEQDYDETRYAKLIAEQFGTNHHEFEVKPEALKIFPVLVRQYEEPYADSSGIAVYYLAQLTRKYVTVALDGDGGDENFAGYPWYTAQRVAYLYERVPQLLRERVVRPALLKAFAGTTTLARRARIFLETHREHPGIRHSQYMAYFTEAEKDWLYGPKLQDIRHKLDARSFLENLYNQAKANDPLDKTLWADIHSYLPDDLLVKVDIASMAHGLESRPPLLDHELMELTARIPAKLKERYGYRKYIFKKALRGILPPSILSRKKQGFGVPLEHWFRNELRDFTHNLLLSRQAIGRGLFDRRGVGRLLAEHATGHVNHGGRIWALATLEQWFKEFF